MLFGIHCVELSTFLQPDSLVLGKKEARKAYSVGFSFLAGKVDSRGSAVEALLRVL